MTSLRTDGYPGVEREMAVSLHLSVLKTMCTVQATPQDPVGGLQTLNIEVNAGTRHGRGSALTHTFVRKFQACFWGVQSPFFKE